jgi:hypothetical protein
LFDNTTTTEGVTQMVRLDVTYLFELAGGPSGLLGLLDKHTPGHDLPYPTVQMWSQRETIPGRWMPCVLYAMSQEGHDFLSLINNDAELAAR